MWPSSPAVTCHFTNTGNSTSKFVGNYWLNLIVIKSTKITCGYAKYIPSCILQLYAY